MARSKPYSSQSVNSVDVPSLCKARVAQRCMVGVDVAKKELLVVVRWLDGAFQKPWRVPSPQGIGLLMEKLVELNAHCPVTVAMESSGTYGDVLRQASGAAGLAVVRVSSKAVKDESESFDGVPSQHDGKDAAVIADLAARNKCRPWDSHPRDSQSRDSQSRDQESAGAEDSGAEDQELRYWVRRLDGCQRIKQMRSGQLEGLLARHWPEVSGLLKLSGATLSKALVCWGDPREMAQDPEAAAKLAKMGGHYLKAKKIKELIESARQTVGVVMSPWDKREVQDLARSLLAQRRKIAVCRRRLEAMTKKHEVIQLQKPAVGLVTACVLWTVIGDPRDYDSAGAYRKAMGLNLAEHSSGQWKGQLHLSKRGQRLSRKWMFFSALRWMRSPAVKPWVKRKKARDGGKGMRAVTGVMRKLSLAAWHVARGAKFQARRLFPGTPLPAQEAGSATNSPTEGNRQDQTNKKANNHVVKITS